MICSIEGCEKPMRRNSVCDAHSKQKIRDELPEYTAWVEMRKRCLTTTFKRYADYGGRGITICKRWDKFSDFLGDMGKKPSTKHSLDRINNEGNYEPSNCRWATQVEQQSNKRSTRLITAGGKTQTLLQWARELGVTHAAIQNRIKRGWNIEDAVLTKKGAR